MGAVEENIHHLKFLSDEGCWLLLMRTSRRSEDKFEKFHEIGKKIAKKCNGLPLAAKTLGSVLLFKKTIQEWEKVLKSEMWELEHVEIELFPHLLLSYHELSPMVKRCFSFCAFFLKDKKLKVEKVVRMWIALGYLVSAGDNKALKGREVFEDLAMRSLFQDIIKDESTEQIGSCKMHDIVHDFAQFLRKNGRVEEHGMTKGTCQACDLYLVSKVQEYRSLVWDGESPLNICDCIASLRVLKYRGDLSPSKMQNLIHLKWLDISGTALSEEDVETICKFYFLQTLVLSNCSLEDVLVKLTHLDLSWNDELKELPKKMRNLVELRTLLLSNCSLNIESCDNLCELPEGLGQLSGL